MRTALVPVSGMDYDTHDYMIESDKGVVRRRNNMYPNSYYGELDGVNTGIKGTTLINILDPGDYVIGYVEDKERNAGVLFCHNASGHSIRRYYRDSNTSEVLASGAYLGFSETHPINADIIGDILVWTDYNSPPRKLNMARAVSTSTDWKEVYSVMDASVLSLNVAPPIEAPTWSWGTDATRKVNKMLGKSFQFASQFVYKDNEISTVSPLSSIVIPPSLFLNSEQVFIDESAYNYVTISADTGSSEVKEVRFLAREGNNGSWFIINEYEKTGTDHNTNVFVVFANDVVRKYVTDEQSSTFYSDVPLLAKDVKAVANRLVLAGVKKGYDVVDADFDISLEYEDVSSITPTGGVVTDGIDYSSGLGGDYYIKFTPGVISTGEELSVNIGLLYSQYWLVDGFKKRLKFNATYSVDEPVLVGDTVDMVLSRIAAKIDDSELEMIELLHVPMEVSIVIETSVIAGSLYVYFRGVYSPSGSATYDFSVVPSYDSELGTSSVSSVLGAAAAVSSYKSGSYYNVAIEFLDEYGRTSGALNPQKIYVPFNSERDSENIGDRVRLAFDVTAITPPSWATHYRFMVSESVSYSAVFPFITNEAYDTTEGNRDVCAIRIPTEAGYEFNNGDFLLYDDTNAITFQVITSKVGITVTGTDYEGIFIIVPRSTTYDAAYYKGKVLSIYRPKNSVTETVFFEDYNTYTITGGAMDTLTGYIDCGDVHVCYRIYDTAGGTEAWVEDFVADIPSGLRAYSKGRPMVVLSEFGEVELQDICWGGKYFDNTDINDLSFFKPLDRMQMNEANGVISRIVLVGDVLKVLQENKETSLYIGKGQITDANGNLVTVMTGTFIGAQNASELEYGTKFPQSVVVNNRDLYYWDGDRGEVIRSSPNGQFPISSYKMRSYFYSKKAEVDSGTLSTVLGHFDRKNNIYGLTFSVDGVCETVLFKDGMDMWVTFVDYWTPYVSNLGVFSQTPPSCFGSIGNVLYSFTVGEMWEHESNVLLNSFYGVQYDSFIEQVFNENPEIEKNLVSLGIDSNIAPNTIIESEESPTLNLKQKTVLYPASYRSREGKYVSPVYNNIKTTAGDDLSLLHNGLKMKGRAFNISLTFDVDEELEYRLLEIGYLPVR